jgi:hypothetical protein
MVTLALDYIRGHMEQLTSTIQVFVSVLDDVHTVMKSPNSAFL